MPTIRQLHSAFDTLMREREALSSDGNTNASAAGDAASSPAAAVPATASEEERDALIVLLLAQLSTLSGDITPDEFVRNTANLIRSGLIGTSSVSLLQRLGLLAPGAHLNLSITRGPTQRMALAAPENMDGSRATASWPPGAPTSDVPVPVPSHLASGPTTKTLQRPVLGGRAATASDLASTHVPGAPLSPSSTMALFLPYGGRLSRFQREFDSVMHIGSGSFGHVYRARHRVDGCQYAVKRVSVRYSEARLQIVLREVRALARMSHPNICRYYGAWLEPAWLQPVVVGDGEGAGPIGIAPLAPYAKAPLALQDGKAASGSSSGSSRGEQSSYGYDYSGVNSSRGAVSIDSIEGSDYKRTHGYGFGYATEASGGAFTEAIGDGDGDDRCSRSSGAPNDDWARLPAIELSSELLGSSQPSLSNSQHGSDTDSVIDAAVYGRSPESQTTHTMDFFDARRYDGNNYDDKRGRDDRRRYGKRHDRGASASAGRDLTLFIQMSLCEGMTLRHWLAQSSNTPAKWSSADTCGSEQVDLTRSCPPQPRSQARFRFALRIFGQILGALAHAHECGIIHRDIKPENIFLVRGRNASGADHELTKDGYMCAYNAVVGDFGLATCTDTRTGVATGTSKHFENNVDVGTDSKPRASSVSPTDVGTDTMLSPEVGETETVTSTADAGAGVARNSVAQTAITRCTGGHTSGVGTASYASPEQLAGTNYGTPSDVFSLGVLIVELLAGFETAMERALAFQALRSDPPKLPAKLCEFSDSDIKDAHGDDVAEGKTVLGAAAVLRAQARLTARVRGLLLRCLARNPAERPTAAAGGAELELALQGVSAATAEPKPEPAAPPDQVFASRPAADSSLAHQKDPGPVDSIASAPVAPALLTAVAEAEAERDRWRREAERLAEQVKQLQAELGSSKDNA